MKSLDERSQTFVVRIWHERRDLADAVPMWRGRVDDIKSGSRAYFTSLQQLMEYLSGTSGADASRPSLRR